ncbi:MAG: GIY-YIG nuclease family protein [Clostridium perfringens]|nr:GIY-YIG nuclease family protein [Clostridium perfringens]
MYLNLIKKGQVRRLKRLITKSMFSIVPFCNVASLPKQQGVYFIYENSDLVYIGKAQNLKTRCMQYLQKGTGRTFREKLMKKKV